MMMVMHGVGGRVWQRMALTTKSKSRIVSKLIWKRKTFTNSSTPLFSTLWAGSRSKTWQKTREEAWSRKANWLNCQVRANKKVLQTMADCIKRWCGSGNQRINFFNRSLSVLPIKMCMQQQQYRQQQQPQ